MSKTNTVRNIVNRNIERQLVREYLLRETERAGFGGLEFNRTPEGTKVTLQAEQVGRVIGRRGKVIHELQRRLQEDFNLDKPRLEVNEIEEPRLNAQVMASRLASSLERGWFFRRAGHSTSQNIMDAGARGCLIILSGKISGARHRVQKFQKGHIKFCGETALEFMDEGFSTAVKKLGTIGCTVRIMRPGVRLPHEISIQDRAESGLGPIEEVSMLEIPDEEPEAPVVDEVAQADAEEVADNVVEKIAEIEAAAEESDVATDTSDDAEEVTESVDIEEEAEEGSE
ncbi:MAG: 30S ribosomal protein S3 [Candidatus Thalassarchaeaceae archaeon]|nr:30S ribosomal protein S3 [Candidatus Thalassarchaeaceae archaeon]MDP6317925.1 30S ribosomal protein S3 [Candidatus Thalassarchaeaceae archaeon]HIH79823.1 30S ribosomal protein S3 [Candidatus Thalassarchaeaceae archaeon]HJM29670.1 30S ribosomal protein S3 [Candidatus Thalassarchaeaceae archaeon]HJN69878.1 30S ribosomal protein S3 [Candidatus Thalassarchaeaceae archaeon]